MRTIKVLLLIFSVVIEESTGIERSRSDVSYPNQRIEEKIRFQNNTEIVSSLQFLDVPRGVEMRIHDLRLEEEYLLFEALSTLMGYFQPGNIPVELLQKVAEDKAPLQPLLFQLVKMEIGVVGWILFWLSVTVCVSLITMRQTCCHKSNLQRLSEDLSDISMDFRDKCTERTMEFLQRLLLLVFLVPVILIFVGNDQISRQMGRSPLLTSLVFEDFNTFIRNTHMQISFVVTSSTDITMEAIRKDLEDVRDLLGRPFQKELEAETGIDIALNGLEELKLATVEVTSLLDDLQHECISAYSVGNLLQDQLKEIARELTTVRQQCRPRDRALCYSLQYTGLDVIFSCGNLTADLEIKHLESVDKEGNFNNSVEKARITFGKLPELVSGEATSHAAEIKNLLSKKRAQIYNAVYSLDQHARFLTDSVSKSQQNITPLIQSISDLDVWRWLIILSISIVLLFIWSLLLCGTSCGCGITSRTIPLLLSGVIISSLICWLVWSLGTLSFLVGSHGLSLLCHPLYDQPHYKTLGEVFNSGGILYKEGGILRGFLKANESIGVETVLRDCQNNKPAYQTFHLHNLFDTNLVNYKSWDDFTALMDNFTILQNNKLEVLNPWLQLNLQTLSTISFDLTKHRSTFLGPVTRRDLNSFADQLSTTSRQLTDPTTSRKLHNLAVKLRIIIDNQMSHLDELRESLLYRITTINILIHNLNKEANQSLSHLRTIQYFIEGQVRRIAERNCKKFTKQIENYLEQLQRYIRIKVEGGIGKSKPIWNIFHAVRYSICRLVMDPINGISVCCFVIILLLLVIVSVALKLVQFSREINEQVWTSSHRRLTIEDEGTWATPLAETPEFVPQSENRTWIAPSPRQPSAEPPIPRPPRLPMIASRISAARVPQISSISRARSPNRYLEHFDTT